MPERYTCDLFCMLWISYQNTRPTHQRGMVVQNNTPWNARRDPWLPKPDVVLILMSFLRRFLAVQRIRCYPSSPQASHISCSGFEYRWKQNHFKRKFGSGLFVRKLSVSLRSADGSHRLTRLLCSFYCTDGGNKLAIELNKPLWQTNSIHFIQQTIQPRNSEAGNSPNTAPLSLCFNFTDHNPM